MKRFLMLVSIVALSLAASGLLLAQSNPAIGTWKLNPAKSKYSPGETGSKSRTRTVEAQGDGFKITVEGVAGDGSRIAYSYTTKYDGKDSPISGAGPDGADTIAAKRVDANTTTAIEEKAGKVVVTTRTVVSKDGKVTTVTSKGTNKQGQPTTTTTVYEKQ